MKQYILDNGEEIYINDAQICTKKIEIDRKYAILSMSDGSILRVENKDENV